MATYSDLTGTLLDHELGTSDSTVLFTTARRQAAVKAGENEFADLTECLTRESTVTITGGTGEYNLNSTSVITGGDFSRLSNRGLAYAYTDASSNVTWVSGEEELPRRDIPWLDRYQPGWRTSTGATLPSAYYLKDEGGRFLLGFYPPPSTGSSASAKVLVPYVALPSTDVSSTYVPFTVGTNYRTDLTPYHQALVHYAAYQLEKLRKNVEAEQQQLQKFTGYLTRYIQSKAPKGLRSLRFARIYFRPVDEDINPNPTWIRTG